MKIFQGIDLVRVARMEQMIQSSGKTFLGRVFTAEEQAYCNSKRMKYEHYAARFAAKEAILKALKIKSKRGYRLSDIEIRRQPTGKPYIVLAPGLRKQLRIPTRTQMELSLAHEREYAIATVVVILPSSSKRTKI